MNVILKKVNIVCFLAVICILASCKSEMDGFIANENVNVAKLLQRSAKIQLGNEWDEVQNNYSKLKTTLTENNDDNKSKIRLAQLFIKEARVTGEHGHYYPAALKLLNHALSNESLRIDEEFLVLTNKAGVHLSLHNFKTALEIGNRAALLNPSNAQIHGVLVDANVELGNYEKAVTLADRMLSIKPDIRSYSRASYLREIHGDVNGSKDAMQLAVKAGYPGLEETAWAMQTLGDLYKNYGALDTAKMIYTSILKMRPNYPFAVGALGDLLIETHKYDEAETTLNKAIDIIPEVGFYISLAHLYKMQNRQDELDSIIKEILVMLEEDTTSGHNMNLEYADLYLNLLNDKNKALDFAKVEYLKRPKNIDVNLKMSQIYLALNNKVKALSHVEKAMITKSKNPLLKDIVEVLKS